MFIMSLGPKSTSIYKKVVYRCPMGNVTSPVEREVESHELLHKGFKSGGRQGKHLLPCMNNPSCDSIQIKKKSYPGGQNWYN